MLKVLHLAITHLSPPHIAFSDKSKYLETGHRAQARGESRGDNFHRQVTLRQVTEGVPTNHKGRRCASATDATLSYLSVLHQTFYGHNCELFATGNLEMTRQSYRIVQSINPRL